MTPEILNLTSDDDLFSLVDSVVSTADPNAAQRPILAPFVTNALALRVYNRAQTLVNTSRCELSAQVALALVLLDATGVLPRPDDRGEQEQIGQRV